MSHTLLRNIWTGQPPRRGISGTGGDLKVVFLSEKERKNGVGKGGRYWGEKVFGPSAIEKKWPFYQVSWSIRQGMVIVSGLFVELLKWLVGERGVRSGSQSLLLLWAAGTNHTVVQNSKKQKKSANLPSLQDFVRNGTI